MKVFSEEKLLKWLESEKTETTDWYVECDGKEIIDGRISGTFYVSMDEWCIEVEFNMIEKIKELRELVYMEDILSPTVPEYIEHHESIQRILKFIDNELLIKVEDRL